MTLLTLGLLILNTAETSLEASPDAGFGLSQLGLLFKMLLALILVVGIAYVVLKWVAPKFGSGFGQWATKKNQVPMEVVSRMPLGAKSSLYVVEVDGQKVLLGVSEQSVTYLKDV